MFCLVSIATTILILLQKQTYIMLKWQVQKALYILHFISFADKMLHYIIGCDLSMFGLVLIPCYHGNLISTRQ